MWALIMTTYLVGGIKIKTLDNFSSEQACRYAGAKQELALRQDLKIDTSKKYTFVCVKKD